jgi:hypothetical protein
MKKRWVIAIVLGISMPAAAALSPTAIPKDSQGRFWKEGIFNGGTEDRAVFSGIRLGRHSKQGVERWVLDFSDPQKMGSHQKSPKFQIDYQVTSFDSKAEKSDLGLSSNDKAYRIVVHLRGITRNLVESEKLKSLIEKSLFVQDIILYPPIEKGDMAMELILKSHAELSPHQPSDSPGRLVLDLRSTR